jgi:hypothetical protein
MKVILFVLLASPTSLVSASFDVKACFTLDGVGVQGAWVECKDEDWGPDDDVGSGPASTDSNGCVTITDNHWWWESPDVYCKISANDECFASINTVVLNNHNKRQDADLGTTVLTFDEDYCGVFGSDTNGCGPEWFPSWANDVATSISGFDTQCMVHDACYADCAKTRSSCDDDFHDDMGAVCGAGSTCNFLADVYYGAVSSSGGEDACEASRNQCTQAGVLRCSQ